jgi:hypothetical protein
MSCDTQSSSSPKGSKKPDTVVLNAIISDLGLVKSDCEARMNWSARKTVQRRFLVAVGHAIYVTWPVLSVILAIQVTLGLLIGFVEG